MSGDWRPIETAPRKQYGHVIGYTSWGQHAGKFHEHVGICEWITDHFEFIDVDFDVFPKPTHWHPLPEPPRSVTVELPTAQKAL